MKKEEEEKKKENKLLIILSGVGRYILGLIILISPAIIILLNGNEAQVIILAMLTPPINLVVAPQVLVGLYFMVTGKTRIRIDITLLLLVVICTIGLLGTSFL